VSNAVSNGVAVIIMTGTTISNSVLINIIDSIELIKLSSSIRLSITAITAAIATA
jgi:hypothetical protein